MICNRTTKCRGSKVQSKALQRKNILLNTEEVYVERKLKKEVNAMLKQKVDTPAENSLPLGQDSRPKIQSEADAMHQGSYGLEDPIPEPKSELESESPVDKHELNDLEGYGLEKQQESASQNKVSETPEVNATRVESQNPKMIQQDVLMKDIQGDFLVKYTRTREQEVEINRVQPRDISQIEQHPEQNVTCENSGDSGNVCPQELENRLRNRPESKDALVRLQESKEETACCPKREHETSFGVVNKNEPKAPLSYKNYVTIHRRGSDTISARKCKIEEIVQLLPDSRQGSKEAAGWPKQTTGYVTFPHRKCNASTRSLKTIGYVTARPRRPETLLPESVKVLSTLPENKEYVTAQPKFLKPKKTVPEPTHKNFYDLLNRAPRGWQRSTYSPMRQIITSPTPMQDPEPRASSPETGKSASVRLGSKQGKKKKASSLKSLDPTLSPLPPESSRKSGSSSVEESVTMKPKKKTFLFSRSFSCLGSGVSPTHQPQTPPLSEDMGSPLVHHEEASADTEPEIQEPRVARRRIVGILMPPLSAGVQDFLQKFCEQRFSPRWQIFFKVLFTVCMILLYVIIVYGSIAASLGYPIYLYSK